MPGIIQLSVFCLLLVQVSEFVQPQNCLLSCINQILQGHLLLIKSLLCVTSKPNVIIYHSIYLSHSMEIDKYSLRENKPWTNGRGLFASHWLSTGAIKRLNSIGFHNTDKSNPENVNYHSFSRSFVPFIFLQPNNLCEKSGL